MSREFETKQVEAKPIVGIRTTTTMEKITEVMGPLFGEVHGYMQQSGREPAGMPFTIYTRWTATRWTLNAGCRWPRAWMVRAG